MYVFASFYLLYDNGYNVNIVSINRTDAIYKRKENNDEK